MRHAAGVQRRGPAGKPRHREIEAAPEEMHRAALADEARAELPEHAVALHQRPPEAVRGVRFVVAQHRVLRERRRVRQFIRMDVDFHRDAEPREFSR